MLGITLNLSLSLYIYIYIFFFYFTAVHVGSWSPDQKLGPSPLQWKLGILTTGLQENSLLLLLLSRFSCVRLCATP